MTDVLAGLRARFAERCVADARAISDYLDGRPGEEPLERIIHRLAGAAGMFGAHEVGTAAQSLDEGYGEGRVPSEAELRKLLALLEAI